MKSILSNLKRKTLNALSAPMVHDLIRRNNELQDLVCRQHEEIKMLENRPRVPNFHQVATPMHTQLVENIRQAAYGKTVEDLSRILNKEAVDMLVEVFQQMPEPDERMPNMHAAMETTSDVVEVEMRIPAIGHRFRVFPGIGGPVARNMRTRAER